MNWLRRLFRRRETPETRVVVFKTRTCPLCDEALAFLEGERRRRSFRLEVVDVTDDPALFAIHRNEVPVVFVDGKKRFFGRVDPVLFRRLTAGG